MDCPFCHSSQVCVTNSRPTKSDSQIWRRRLCTNCHLTFTTYERIDLSYLTVVKKDGRTQRFDRSKLYASIYHPGIEGKHVDRGDMAKLAEEITQEVEQQLLQLKRRRIPTTQLVGIVLETLKNHSAAIFLRYLAYREGDSPKATLRRYIRLLSSTLHPNLQ